MQDPIARLPSLLDWPDAGGCVALVGAGPGDPGLITVAAARLLATCDVVVYDALANAALLSLAPRARHVYAGKRAEHHSMTQDDINALLVEEGHAGRRVVRLKGGDPFVFGRGGEEALALAAAGVKFLVVPGVTAAVAAGAFAGIPVTHRGLATSFTVVTGHERDPDAQTPDARRRQEDQPDRTDWSALARLPSIAVYMGVKPLGRLCRRLVEAGMDPQTPAAVIEWAATPRQRVVEATVATLADAAAREHVGAPAVSLIGPVVGLRRQVAWLEGPDRPLLGRTILVTRSRDGASALAARLVRLGACVLEAHLTHHVPPADTSAVDAALHEVSRGRWPTVAFTSANGVRQTRIRTEALGLDGRIFAGVRLAAVGPATAHALRHELRLRPDVVPDVFHADALADVLVPGTAAGSRVLLLRADVGRPSLVKTLQSRGVEVADVAVYETRRAAGPDPAVTDALARGDVDAVLFASGGAARGFADLYGTDSAVRVVSIGPQTSAALREANLPVDAEADRASLDALAVACVGILRRD